MARLSKTKTLYSNTKNVDVSSLVKQTGGADVNVNKVTKTKTNKTNKNNKGKKTNKNNDSDSEYEDSVDDSEYGNSDDDNEIDDSEEEDEEDNNDNNENNDIEDNDEGDGDENIGDDDYGDEDDDIKNKNNDKDSVRSDVDSDNESVGDEKDKDYIDNEETLKTKCYSKYARIDYDELDFDELFGEESLVNTKNVRLTKPILTKYEFVRLLTDRTKQLAQGAKPMLKNITGLSSKEIAKLELKNKIIPLIIERPIPNSNVERWKLSELEIPDYLFSN